MAVLYLDHHVEGGGRLPLQDALLRAPSLRLLVTQCDRLDSADKVRERGVHHQVLETIAVRRPDQLYATLSDRASRGCFQLCAYLVNDYDLGHVVLHRLDHHSVLQARGRDLHPARATDRRVGYVTVAGYLIGSVDDDDALTQFLRHNPADLAQHRRLTHTRAPKDKDALTALHKVADNVDRAHHGATHATGDPYDLHLAVSDRADTVEGSFYPCSIVVAERAYAGDDVLDVLGRHLRLTKRNFPVGESCLRQPTEV